MRKQRETSNQHSSCAHFLSSLGYILYPVNERFERLVSVGISTCHQMKCDLSSNIRCVRRANTIGRWLRQKWLCKLHEANSHGRNHIQCACEFFFSVWPTKWQWCNVFLAYIKSFPNVYCLRWSISSHLISSGVCWLFVIAGTFLGTGLQLHVVW